MGRIFTSGQYEEGSDLEVISNIDNKASLLSWVAYRRDTADAITLRVYLISEWGDFLIEEVKDTTATDWFKFYEIPVTARDKIKVVTSGAGGTEKHALYVAQTEI